MGYRKVPQFMVMSLGEDHTSGTRPGAFTPGASVASNDLALGRIVEAISKSALWHGGKAEDRPGRTQHAARLWRESARMDWSAYDRADPVALNRILWHSIRGRDMPLPSPQMR